MYLVLKYKGYRIKTYLLFLFNLVQQPLDLITWYILLFNNRMQVGPLFFITKWKSLFLECLWLMHSNLCKWVFFPLKLFANNFGGLLGTQRDPTSWCGSITSGFFFSFFWWLSCKILLCIRPFHFAKHYTRPFCSSTSSSFNASSVLENQHFYIKLGHPSKVSKISSLFLQIWSPFFLVLTLCLSIYTNE